MTNLGQLVLADIDGDGRADYLIFDDGADISGYLNIMTQWSGTALFQSQGGAKSIASDSVRFADIDGDGVSLPNSFVFFTPFGAYADVTWI